MLKKATRLGTLINSISSKGEENQKNIKLLLIYQVLLYQYIANNIVYYLKSVCKYFCDAF